MKEKFGPCLEKKCSWCCDPVKVRNPFFGDVPTSSNGERIWKERAELLAPESSLDERLKVFDCLNFDTTTGLCKNYESRPDICKKTSCIDENLKESVDTQHRKVLNEKFIRIISKKKQ